MKIKIVSTSDVHGYIYPTNFTSRNDYHGLGYLKAGAVIEKIRRQAEQDGDIVLYVEDGDFVEGSPMTDYAYQLAMKSTITLIWLRWSITFKQTLEF